MLQRISTLIKVGLVWCFPCLLSAQIGETREQLKARYGPALSVGGQDVFESAPFHITVFYDELGRSRLMIYALASKARKAITNNVEAYMKKIMTDLSNGLDWNLVEKKVSEATYLRSDKKLFARVNYEENLIFFMTPDAMRAYERR
ncbi:MAG: hypothetical protein NZM04_05680 [Methylacidiphilales bacterium]|nr:hypothetical protein [Candidatus Methylacidiphilales bacterium]MDW8349518.1 hypothetical protein [Verrucomicrobiae bacterium]